VTVDEGTIAVSGHQVWYRRVDGGVGGGAGIPLLVLHGGPGAGSDYLESLEDLADRRPVVFYDQLGCGRSDQPEDVGLWTLPRFVEEISVVRAALGLDQVHLLGQSWGGFLALEYLLTDPPGVRSAVLSSTAASIPQAVGEMTRLRQALPDGLYDVMLRHEARGDYHHPEYEMAVLTFYLRHLIRLPEIPDAVLRSLANLDGNRVYEVMNGPNEFTISGTLRDWDRIPDLPRISTPTLITVGAYDELTPACAQTLHDGLADARLEIFADSAHMAHWEERERFMSVVGAFLGERD
jgi:proline-specific peptidase